MLLLILNVEYSEREIEFYFKEFCTIYLSLPEDAIYLSLPEDAIYLSLPED